MSGPTHDTTHHSVRPASPPSPGPLWKNCARAKSARASGSRATREIITVSMGPHHPSMHGVYQAVVDLDGEIIVADPAGHRQPAPGVEKLAESRTYHQFIPLTDRLDYIASFAMNHGYCKAVEKLMGVEVPASGPSTSAPCSTSCAASPTTSCGWACTSWTSGPDLPPDLFPRPRVHPRPVRDALPALGSPTPSAASAGWPRTARMGSTSVTRGAPTSCRSASTSTRRLIESQPHLPQAGQGDRHLHRRGLRMPGASPARRCARPAWRATCARTSPTPPTRISTSRSAWSTKPMCTPGTGEDEGNARVHARSSASAWTTYRRASSCAATPRTCCRPRRTCSATPRPWSRTSCTCSEGPQAPVGEVYSAIETAARGTGLLHHVRRRPEAQRLRITTPCLLPLPGHAGHVRGRDARRHSGHLRQRRRRLGSCDR